MSRTFAVIPAAGKSTRMGRPKLALPLGNRSVIERVVDALRQAGVEHILVVVAPHVPELMTLAQAASADVLMLVEETPDMRATVDAGLRWLEQHYAPQPGDTCLLVPADHPVIDPGVVRQLLRARTDHADCSIVLPAYAGRRGHPALIDWKHVVGMRNLPAGQGLNVYLRGRSDDTYEVLVDSPTVLLDLDTPEDYEKLQRNWSGATGWGDRSIIRWLVNFHCLCMVVIPWSVGFGLVLAYFGITIGKRSGLPWEECAVIGFVGIATALLIGFVTLAVLVRSSYFRRSQDN